MTIDTEQQMPKTKSDHDPRLVKHLARVISGLKKPEWVALGKEGQKPHMVSVKRLLTAQKRFLDRPPSDREDRPDADS